MLLYQRPSCCRAIVTCSSKARIQNAAASASVKKLPYLIICSAAAGAGNIEEEPATPITEQQQPVKHGLIGRIKSVLLGGKVDKAKLAEYGLGE